MKRIKTLARPDAVQRILKAVKDAGLCITATVRLAGRKIQEITLYTKDEEALAAVMLVKGAAYAADMRDGEIVIHNVHLPTQQIS